MGEAIATVNEWLENHVAVSTTLLVFGGTLGTTAGMMVDGHSFESAVPIGIIFGVVFAISWLFFHRSQFTTE